MNWIIKFPCLSLSPPPQSSTCPKIYRNIIPTKISQMYLTPQIQQKYPTVTERLSQTEIEDQNTVMSSSSFFSSSILNISTSDTRSVIKSPSKILCLDNPFPKINIPRNSGAFAISLQPVKSSADSTTIVEDNVPAETSSNSGGIYDEEDQKAAEAQRKIGARVRVKVPLKVYHVPKVPAFELTGKVGTLKQYVAVHKGKRISSNLPYKVQFVVDNIEGRKGPLKFLAHLKEDEFEYLD